MILCKNNTLVYDIVRHGIENLKAHLARKSVMKDGHSRMIFDMKTFKDWKNQKF